MPAQQTTTHDFTCSVSEFTSSTGSIHVFPYVNSLDSVNKFGVSTRVYHEITNFSRDDTYQWNCASSDPVWLVSNSFKTCDNRQNVYSREYTWKQLLMERYQLWTSMTRANWFRNDSLFAGCNQHKHRWHLGYNLRPTNFISIIVLIQKLVATSLKH